MSEAMQKGRKKKKNKKNRQQREGHYEKKTHEKTRRSVYSVTSAGSPRIGYMWGM